MSLATSAAQPLVLADGRIVHPDGNIVDPKQEKLVAIPTNREATQLVLAARRKLSDLPDVPRTMNTVSVIMAYSLFGLDDVEIALATGLTEGQIGRIKVGDPYTKMYETIVGSILETETGDVRDLFRQHSRSAVTKLLTVLEHTKSETNRIAVARDILDRAGHRPADVVEHRHKMDGGLTIEIRRREDKVIPVIDIKLED